MLDTLQNPTGLQGMQEFQPQKRGFSSSFFRVECSQPQVMDIVKLGLQNQVKEAMKRQSSGVGNLVLQQDLEAQRYSQK